MSTVTGQITLIDLTDERTSSFYLQADKSKIQIYDPNTKIYEPDYEKTRLTITPLFFFGAEDYSSKLNYTNISYKINDLSVGSFSGAEQNGASLVIFQNINASSSVAPFNSDVLKVVATIKKEGIVDEKTGISNDQAITADIDFAKVSTGLQGSSGVGVSEVNQLYLLTDSTEVPNTPDKGNLNWSKSNPTWDSTKTQYLWICTEIVYTDGSKTYSTPYTDSNWKTATEAVQSMAQSFGTLKTQVDTLQGEVDSAIETWYLEGEPSAITPPWGEEDNSKHIGDLYYDIKTGYSYRFFKKSTGVYEWSRISDSDITKALEDVSKLQTVVDGKVTIYYDSTAPQSTTNCPLNKDDLWMPPNGNFYKWDGDSWELANEIIDRIEVQYNKNQSNIVAPSDNDPNWSVITPTWENGYYIWQRTATYYKERTNPVLSNSTCISVAGAAGENAIFAIVESTSKLIFTNNDEEDIILNAILYMGGKKIESDVTYTWSSIPSGSITTLPSTPSSIRVQRDDVTNLKTYICAINYNGEVYKDRITITDKIDSVYCIIKSTGGDKFTNNNISTTLKCCVFDGNGEVDANAINGNYIYTYTWNKYVDNKQVEGWLRTGKTITIGRDDVAGKAIFSCTVTR